MNQGDFKKCLEIVATYSNDKKTRTCLSDIFLGLGVLSLVGSVASWVTASRENRAYRERFSLFLGLFVPSCLILSSRLLPNEAEKKD